MKAFSVSAKCPANPTTADAFVAEESPVFQSLVIKELVEGETFVLQQYAVILFSIRSKEKFLGSL